MLTKCLKLTKTRAVALLLMLGVMLAAAVVLCSSPRSIFSTGDMLDVSQLNGREKYLASYGWVIDPASETERTVLLPKKFEGTVRDYADMQTDQGYDFAFYSGLECRQFTYEVTNYDGCDGHGLCRALRQGHARHRRRYTLCRDKRVHAWYKMKNAP